jgi:Ribbon-helix-helix protein, copG family
MKPTDRVQLKVYLPRAQRDELAALAARRGLSVGTLIRQHIATLTGVPDTLGPQKWKGKT